MYTISNVSNDFVKCKDEQAFKKLYCNKYLKVTSRMLSTQKVMCIETEETIAGFPDVIELMTYKQNTTIKFFEFKISDARGDIKFQPSQPAFYKNNQELSISVIAYNRLSQRVHVFSTNEIFDKHSPYYSASGRISLTNAEKEIGV